MLARDTATAKNSQSQQARYEDLFKRGLIPRDQYETQMATASAQQATLAADQAAVDTARLNLQYTSISAPIAGRAGALTVHQGDLVRQNDTTPLLVINQMAPIYVGFSVPGRYPQRYPPIPGAAVAEGRRPDCRAAQRGRRKSPSGRPTPARVMRRHRRRSRPLQPARRRKRVRSASSTMRSIRRPARSS